MHVNKVYLKKLVILLTIFFTIAILNIKFNVVIPCLFNKITHLYCPGCGITRMFKALMKLDLKRAFSYNQFAFLSLPFFLIYFIDEVRSKLFYKKKILNAKIINVIAIILIVLAVIFGVIRNIPGMEILTP